MPGASKRIATTPEHHPDWQQSKWRSDLRRRLMKWFSQHAREMPWRSDPSPYHVWVSEIMLQQTQVATVLPYYQRWMKRFPSVKKLAEAEESDLMRHWEGLGYYRRVRSMHSAAKQIMEQHGGVFPLHYDAVLALPGIGRYTAGAVLSISDGQRLPVLEGNTQRVYSRWIGLREHPMEKNANALLWELATKMLPQKESGLFNQAAMELGALVCQPKNPSCDICPVLKHCHTAELGLQADIPGKIKKVAYEDRTEFAFVIQHPKRKIDSFLVRPLPEGGRWAGLWDFPRPTDVKTVTVGDAADWLSGQMETPVQPGLRLKTIRHAVTKYRISLHVHLAEINVATDAKKPVPRIMKPWKWVTLKEMNDLPMSVTGRKIADFLAKDTQALLPLS